jgi:hypothetical protein
VIATPPPALVYAFFREPGYPGFRRLAVTVKCTGWTAALGLSVRQSQIGAVKIVLERERKSVASGRYGFRTQADRCTQKQAEAARTHAEHALKVRGLG